MAFAYRTASDALKDIINTEFAPDHVVAVDDELHESLGTDRVEVGIAPDYKVPSPGNYTAQETYIKVQFFDLWEIQVDPTQRVDPRNIADKAERFERALKVYEAANAGSSEVWFFNVERIDFPRDPTGNKTRFIATVRAWGNNPGLVETSA